MSVVYLILLGLVYLQIGYWTGRASSSVWKKKERMESSRALSFLFFPVSTVENSREAFISTLHNPGNEYLFLSSIFWPIKWGWNIVAFVFYFGYFVLKYSFGYFILPVLTGLIWGITRGPAWLLERAGEFLSGRRTVRMSIRAIGKRLGLIRQGLRKVGLGAVSKLGTLVGAFEAARDRTYLKLAPFDPEERQQREYELAAAQIAEIERQRITLEDQAEALRRQHPDLRELN